MPTRRPVVSMVLCMQEIPYDSPDSRFLFRLPFVATRAALEEFGMETLLVCLARLQHQARIHAGLDYLQVFEDDTSRDRRLWFIEDGQVVTALLPSDY